MEGEKEFLNRITKVVPTDRQINWQKLEFTAFFHYGINSFTNREWGDGKEDISIFYPKQLDTDEWCKVLQSAGIKACILTCKHHDGFCLWDSAYTEHCVRNTPYKEDILAKLSASCRKYNIKLGVYLSPWDRHEPTYGQGSAYDDFFCNQLTELLTNYGEIYTVWFDGACGEGPNGHKQIYDWERYYELIRRLSPDSVISISGPDVRWCGNEAGDCRKSEWSVVPEEVFSNKAIAEASQKEDTAEFRNKRLNEQDKVLGSRKILALADHYIWYPAEVDVSIRPGWFYHEEEDDKVRSLKNLVNLYINSVGGNSVLLLNIPPHRDGYIAKPDKLRLMELGDYLKKEFRYELTENCSIASNLDKQLEKENKILNLLKDDSSYWRTKDFEQTHPVITISFEEEVNVSYLMIKEQIAFSQRVEEFVIDALIKAGDAYIWVYSGTTIGYKKICRIKPIRTKELRITFLKYRKSIVLERIAVY